MDQEQVDDALRAIASETDPSAAADALRPASAEAADIALWWALEMVLVTSEEDERIRPVWRSRYGQVPPDPREWPEEAWNVLRMAYGSDVASALVTAQVGHLLVDFREAAAVVETAREAISAFMDLARRTDIEPFDRLDFLEHAFALASKFQLNDIQEEIRTLGLEIAAASMRADSDRSTPGVFAHYVDAVIAWDGPATQLIPLLDEGIEAYSGSDFVRPALVRQRANITADAAQSTGLLDAEVGRQIADAQARGGFLMLSTLQQALVFAERAELPHRLDEIRRLLADIDPSNLGFSTHTYEYSIPGEVIRGLMALVIDAADGAEAFQNFAGQTVFGVNEAPPRPSGLMSIIPTIHVGQDGLVTHQSQTTEEIESDYARQLDGMTIQTWAPLLHGLFENLIARDDFEEELRQRLTSSPLFTDVGRDRIIRAVDSYRVGDIQTIIGVVPLIESAIRRLVRSMGLTIIRGARGRGALASEKILLGSLIGKILQQNLAPTVRAAIRYWQFFLADPLGHNLRNDLMHGFREEITPPEAAMILHIICQLAALNVTPDD